VTVYFISGMAADERAFKHIVVPPSHKTVHLKWIDPLRNESLPSYAMRLAEGINANEKFAIIGLSMGGMIAAEIANQLKPEHTILISSIPVSSHLPFYYKLFGKLQLHRILPVSFLKKGAKLKRLFTNETGADKKMLRQMILEADDRFIKWSLHAVLSWRNKLPPQNYFHIHGTHDEILPKRFTKPTHLIPGAGHLMVFTRAKKINEILKELLGEV
jgi:pimeloyl-ACP methyl ester carboxylesterase